MAEKRRLCPICNEGYMKPISEIAEDSDRSQKQIKFYECDNEYCGYRSAETGISRDTRVELDEPLMCSKCNIMLIQSWSIYSIMLKGINQRDLICNLGIGRT
jgi:hypothetical protein